MTDCAKPFGRIKLGEIFHIENNGYEFTCGHCLFDFKQFADFAAHIQEYLEEMIMYQRPIDVDSESGSEVPYDSDIVIDEVAMQQMMQRDDLYIDEAVPGDFDNDSQESRDIEFVKELSPSRGQESNTEKPTDDDVVYVVIGDDDSDNDIADADDDDDDFDESGYAALDNDDDYKNANDSNLVNNEILNEPDQSGTSTPPTDGGYKCPLCKSCYSTIYFLQMHLNNYHSKNAIYNYLTVATKNPSKKVNHMPLSKCIEDLPSENILLEHSPETDEYSKYVFEFRFEKTATGLGKCPKCNFTGIISKVKNHVFTHLKKKLFTCMICKQKYHTLAKCRHHMRKMHLCA